jgi:hypothetical protein
MELTFFNIKAATPAEKPYKLSDSDGLYLLIRPNGHKFWRFRYRFAGIEKMLAIGPFPAVSLSDARIKRDEARKSLNEGIDPSVQKKLDRIDSETAARNTFGLVAGEFLSRQEAERAAPSTLAKNKWLLEDPAKPLANRPIAEITAAEILDLLKRIEKSGRRETARRLRGVMGTVFRLAIVTLRATKNPRAISVGLVMVVILSPGCSGRARDALAFEKEGHEGEVEAARHDRGGREHDARDGPDRHEAPPPVGRSEAGPRDRRRPHSREQFHHQRRAKVGLRGVGEARSDGGRMDRRNSHPVSLQLAVHRLAEVGDKRLAGGVSGEIRRRAGRDRRR